MITGTRAVFAIVAFLAVPPSVMALARLGRWPGALTLAALYAVYVGIEVVSWLRREQTRRATQRAYLRSRGRVLADVTYSREDWAA